MIIQKMKKILKSQAAFSELVSSIVGLMVITIMLVISIMFIKVVNHQSLLNQFAYQMSIEVCENGTTDSAEIDERYEQLKSSLGIAPTINYTTSYFIGKKVQFGELITVTASSSIEFSIIGYPVVMDFEIDKTGRSQIYWK